MIGRSSLVPRSRRWERVSWWYSSIFGVAIIALLLTWIFSGDNPTTGVRGVVRDAYSGEPISGANVSTQHATATTDDDGSFVVGDETATVVTVTREDYASAEVSVAGPDATLDVSLTPTTVHGSVEHSESGDPLEGIQIVANVPGGGELNTTSNAQGEWQLSGVTAGTIITALVEGQVVARVVLEPEAKLDFSIRNEALTGIVRAVDGTPIPGAVIQVGDLTAVTNPDGSYRLIAVPEKGTIEVRKPGFRAATAEIPKSLTYDATLQPFPIRALYASSDAISDSEQWPTLLDVAASTEVNALVIDLKDSTGQVYYDTQVPLAAQLGAKNVRYDLRDVLADLQERDIYSIARIAVFEDPLLAVERPELAIVDGNTGGPWVTFDGRAWVNPYQETVWQYAIDLAAEAAELGFDEIQLDSVRFPADGILDNADYGSEFANQPRVDAITGFLQAAQRALRPTGAMLAVTVDGLTLWDDGDGGIGQNYEAIEPYVDVISPVLYPSSFTAGDLGLDLPNNHPFDAVIRSLQSGSARVPHAAGKLRPWLQDFTAGEGIAYGDDQVREQIRAANEARAHGWMLWSPDNAYHTGALQPE